MVTVQRNAAPKAEWVLMYRGGLTRARIAALTGAPASTVGYHLVVARTADPALESAHRQAADGTMHRASAHGLARMRELVTFVQETGQYPSARAGSAAERSLASWLERRGDDHQGQDECAKDRVPPAEKAKELNTPWGILMGLSTNTREPPDVPCSDM